MSNSVTQLVLVLGMSGAGKSTALRTLEDSGFETVDNAPLLLIPGICNPPAEEGVLPAAKKLALSVGVRARDFSTARFEAVLGMLRGYESVAIDVMFLDCADDVLVKRYSETRRRHPLAQDRPVEDGIARERQLLEALRTRANRIIDTTDFGAADLRRLIRHQFEGDHAAHVSLCVTSFSFAKGVPRDADIVFDVRFLRNPHYVDALRPFTGRDPEVQRYIAEDASFASFTDGFKQLVKPLLPRYADEGKSYLTIAIGCTGGKHRSVCVAETLHQWLAEEGYASLIRHRDAPLT